MSSEQDKLMPEFSKLKSNYLHLEAENQILTEKILFLKERLEEKETIRSKLLKMCSEKISKKNETIEALKNENQHLQEVINNQNVQIIEQDKTIERLQNTVNVQTYSIKHPCFENNKQKTRKEKKPQVRFPHLNLIISKKRTPNKSPKLVNGNRQRRKLYISDDETVDLSNNPS